VLAWGPTMKRRPSDLGGRTGRRPRSAFVLLAFLAAAGGPLACPTSTRAEVASTPDSAKVAWVQFELRHFDDVRISTGGAKILVHGPVVYSHGLRLGGDAARRGVTSRTPPQDRLVPWAEVESIHARRGRGGGILLGAVAGLAVVSAFSPSEKVTSTPHFLGLAAGAAVGALADRPGPWHSVYP